MGLLTSLQAYERLNAGLKRRETRNRLADFMPETYRLDDTAEREAFMEAFQGTFTAELTYILLNRFRTWLHL